MKRNRVLVVAVLLGAGFLLWKGAGRKASSEEGVASPSVSQARKEIQGEISQASSSVKRLEESASTSTTEPVLFPDNPHRLVVKSEPLPGGETKSAAGPSSAEALRPSSLWTDQSWQIWKNVTAVPTKDYPAGEKQSLGSLGSYVLIESANVLSDEHQFSSSQPLAVFNSHGNLPGLVTGVFAVKLQDSSDFESFVLDHDLKINGAFPQVRLYYVTANKEPFDLPALQEAFNKDPRVEKATLEIVTQSYAKK